MPDTEIVFTEPCLEDWEAMRPEERRRHCDRCDKPVHDLVHYTPEEADALIFRPEGPACLRAQVMPDGRVITRPSRFGRILLAAVAAPLIAAAPAVAAVDHKSGAIAGSVLAGDDVVRVTASGPGVRRRIRIGADGAYRFERLRPGIYRLEFSSTRGNWTAEDVVVNANHVTARTDMGPWRHVPIMAMPTAGIPVPRGMNMSGVVPPKPSRAEGGDPLVSRPAFPPGKS
jgi:hypothetical protein